MLKALFTMSKALFTMSRERRSSSTEISHRRRERSLAIVKRAFDDDSETHDGECRAVVIDNASHNVD
jgi:hypothetical protein